MLESMVPANGEREGAHRALDTLKRPPEDWSEEVDSEPVYPVTEKAIAQATMLRVKAKATDPGNRMLVNDITSDLDASVKTMQQFLIYEVDAGMRMILEENIQDNKLAQKRLERRRLVASTQKSSRAIAVVEERDQEGEDRQSGPYLGRSRERMPEKPRVQPPGPRASEQPPGSLATRTRGGEAGRATLAAGGRQVPRAHQVPWAQPPVLRWQDQPALRPQPQPAAGGGQQESGGGQPPARGAGADAGGGGQQLPDGRRTVGGVAGSGQPGVVGRGRFEAEEEDLLYNLVDQLVRSSHIIHNICSILAAGLERPAQAAPARLPFENLDRDSDLNAHIQDACPEDVPETLNEIIKHYLSKSSQELVQNDGDCCGSEWDRLEQFLQFRKSGARSWSDWQRTRESENFANANFQNSLGPAADPQGNLLMPGKGQNVGHVGGAPSNASNANPAKKKSQTRLSPQGGREQESWGFKCRIPKCTDPVPHLRTKCLVLQNLSVAERWMVVSALSACPLCLRHSSDKLCFQAASAGGKKECGMGGCMEMHHPMLHQGHVEMERAARKWKGSVPPILAAMSFIKVTEAESSEDSESNPEIQPHM